MKTGAFKHICYGFLELWNLNFQQVETPHSNTTGMFSSAQDLFMETEAMSVKRTSVSRDATWLLHHREADCSALRAKVTQLEVDWSQLTSDLSKTQDQLQQVKYSQRVLRV